jgi:drug/metabolite transporter (DMT)-like permease
LASILFALAAAVSWGVSDFMGGLFARRIAIASVLLISQAVGFTVLLVVAVLLRGAPTLDVQAIGFAMAASAAGMIGIAALYRGMAVGMISIVAPISATGAALPVVFGFVRGERAAPLQMLGIALALVGIVLASRTPTNTSEPAGPILARGVGLAMLAAVGFGAFFILLHEASAVDVLWAGTVQRLTGVGIMALAAIVLRSPVSVPRNRLPGLIAVGVLDTAANVLYGFASTSGLVSIAAVLASLFPVVTVILARLVLLERLARVQSSGVVLALTGVALIAWNPG